MIDHLNYHTNHHDANQVFHPEQVIHFLFSSWVFNNNNIIIRLVCLVLVHNFIKKSTMILVHVLNCFFFLVYNIMKKSTMIFVSGWFFQFTKKFIKKFIQKSKIKILYAFFTVQVSAVCHEAAMFALQEDILSKSVEQRHFDKALTVVSPRISDQLIQFYQNYHQTSGIQNV